MDVPGDCVQLAAELERCATFDPKHWRQVLIKSEKLLRKSHGEGQSSKHKRPLPTLTQYLDQPTLVKSLLEERDDNAIECVEEEQEQQQTRDEAVEMLPNFTEERRLELPLLTTVSPRTRRGLAKLPAVSEAEMREIQNFERSVEQSMFQDFYKQMKKVKRSNQMPQLARSLPKLSPKRKRSEDALKEKKNSVVQKQPGDVFAEELLRAKELKCMEQEDMLNDDALQRGCTKLLEPTPARSLRRMNKQTRSYKRLVQDQHKAATKHDAAESQVQDTINEIRQWIPLDVIYAFGLGKFASPAQQRAAEILFRVSVRLKSQLLYQGMSQWKDWVNAVQQEEQELASIRLQCWWRQKCAQRELKMRKRIRKELQRRQQDLLALLASKQQQAACRITRCIRRYAQQTHRARVAVQLEAAICIQRFWRQLCTHWAALRREMIKQRRNKAAVCIQKHARRILAQRRRLLLHKIRQVEQKRRQKAQEVAARARHTKQLGAILTIQRVFRSWRQRRVLMLRRRRAAFERDKKKILKVQAHYRGQQARRWVEKHKLAVSKAVAVLQCSWRCYRAKKVYQRRKDEAKRRRDELLREIGEHRRAKRLSAITPTQLQNKWSQFSLVKASNARRTGEAASTREVQAAMKLQARWRGKKIRQRMRREKARDKEKLRREFNRKRRLAAVCIQRHVRGIRGRAKAWRVKEEASAERIQRVWKGFKTRTQLMKMKAAVEVVKKIQERWRARQSAENHRFRTRNALFIQRAARKYIGRKMLAAVVRRRQFLAEESAVGKVFVERTRSRTKDELLLQSFSLKALQPPEEKKQKQGKQDHEEATRVNRSLYQVDISKRLWKRRGYDGIWQEVFRNASGNSIEMDNSHFARFLKALPHAFIHKTQFPMQNADVIFAKMKEPKAKALSFPRFNKAILMLLKEKFGDPSSQKQDAKNTEAVDGSGDHDRFLRFMNRFVLPSTIQNGKYRKILDSHCTERLFWAVAVLRRLSIRIATKKRHDEFVIIFREQQLRNQRSKCASTIQLAYHCYKFRLQLKGMLASMFIEFIDHSGRTVRFQHIDSGKILSKRPIFLKGVVCGKIVPLPFPGEEFHAFCERHEDSTNQNAGKVPAAVYCVECEDTMCQVCFDRDHTVRKAFQQHQARTIQTCSYCNTETATRECLQCGNGKVPFCDSCFPYVHQQLLKKQRKPEYQDTSPANEERQHLSDEVPQRLHNFQTLVVMCAECSNRVAQWSCDTCLDIFCKRCMSSFHAKGQRQTHHCRRLNYFSVLRQKAEQKRDADAEKDRERRRKQREEERKRQEAELRRQNLAATKIQAIVRSFVARRKGKAYMKLVRQTQAARAQRIKDQKIRASIAYKVKAAFGVSPALKSDTAQEIAARRQRFENIKQTLLLQRLPFDTNPGKKHWSKWQKARALHAAKTWCDYDAQVRIRKGEWKNCIGSIVSTQNMMLTGRVLVFVPLANRSVVLRWTDIEPFDQDEILRQPYELPHEVALNVTRDFHAKISQVLEAAARKARLLYLQTIEFNDIMQYAWVVEYDKREKKEEYWNVVLNKRVPEPPKAMQLIERMEQEQREKLEKRVALARSKLLALLHPFTPKNMPSLALRRNAVVFVPSGSTDESLASLKQQMEAIDCARFWHDKIVPDRRFGGKKAHKFLSACRSSACWGVAKVLYWMDLHEADGFEPHAKKLLSLAEDLQVYVANAVGDKFRDSGDVEAARDKLLTLLKLDEATLQLLVTKEQQSADEDAARQL